MELISDAKAKAIAENSKLKELYGFDLPTDRWVSEAALDEFGDEGRGKDEQ